jgi:hypothetical protein
LFKPAEEPWERPATLGLRRPDAMVYRENDGAVAFWQARGFELQDEDGRWSLAV